MIRAFTKYKKSLSHTKYVSENNKNGSGLFQGRSGSEQEGSGSDKEGVGREKEGSGSEQEGSGGIIVIRLHPGIQSFNDL